MRLRLALSAALLAATGGSLYVASHRPPAPVTAATRTDAEAQSPARRRLAEADRRAAAARAELELHEAALEHLTPAEEELVADTWAEETATLRLRARQAAADEIIDRRVRELVRRGMPLSELRTTVETRYRDLYQEVVEGGVSAEENAEIDAALAAGAREYEPTPGDRQLDAQMHAELDRSAPKPAGSEE
jgi:hypothetical protein